MKKLLFLFTAICCCYITVTNAQAPPQGFNYQAVARDLAGNVMANQALTVRAGIISSAANGTLQWEETHSTSTSALGLFNIIIGQGTTTGNGATAPFSNIAWGITTHFLKIEINTGAGYLNMGTQQLMSVPYALFSGGASTLPNGSSAGQVLIWDGSQWVPSSICSLFNTDVNNCGSCGNVCGAPPNGTPICTNGLCDFYCNAGYVRCGLSCLPVNALNTDLNNCGGCGVVCPSPPNSVAICVAGQCDFICNAGYTKVGNICVSNATCSDGIKNGNETDVDCGGSCGPCDPGQLCASNNDCEQRPNASVVCQGSVCIMICNSGFANCNGNNTDGCEVNLAFDNSNCGQCGQQCTFPNGFATCNNGTCVIGSCNSGFANCNGLTADGCEINITNNVQNCGSCGHVCAAPNAISSCVNGICFISSCNPGFADCNNNYSDGCEVNLNATPAHCGNCNTTCVPPANATAICVNGMCDFQCNAGFVRNGNICQ